MTVYALDTNIVSYLLRNSGGIAKRMESEIDKGNRVVIPPMVYYEVRRGLLAANAPVKSEAFETMCDTFAVGVIDRDTLEIAAVEYAHLRKIGRPIDDADLIIAAYCIQTGATLVTNNTKHFEGIENLNHTNWVQ